MKWIKIFFRANLIILLQPIVNSNQVLNAQMRGFPKILSNTLRTNQKKKSGQFHYTDHPILFIGKYNDSLQFSENTSALLFQYRLVNPNLVGSTNTLNADSGLVILFDTNQVIGTNERSKDKQNKISITNYDAFPLLIKNNSQHEIIIGEGTNIPVVIEALDNTNNWKMIEENMINNHVVGADKIILAAGDMAAVAIPIYKGSFRTILRVRVFDIYSSPFVGYLNHSQLTEPVK